MAGGSLEPVEGNVAMHVFPRSDTARGQTLSVIRHLQIVPMASTRVREQGSGQQNTVAIGNNTQHN